MVYKRKFIKEALDEDISIIRKHYDTETTADLEFIAKDFYDIKEVVETPLAGPAFICTYENEHYIFYHGAFKPAEKLILGHEIGHMAAQHVFEKGRSRFNPKRYFTKMQMEKEANYFSRRLNEISRTKFSLSLFFDEMKHIHTKGITNLINMKKEISKLEDLEVYEVFRENRSPYSATRYTAGYAFMYSILLLEFLVL